MTITVRLTPDFFPITGKLASHFCDDQIAAADVKREYDRANHILSNPDKFPNADVETLDWLAEALFELSPTAATVGPTL